MRKARNFVLATAASWLVVVEVALAQGGEQVGENVGELLTSWAGAVFAGVAAIVSIIYLISRRYTELAVFFVIAVVVGGFALAPDSTETLVRGIWTTITGGA